MICITYQEMLSAWLDGELSSFEQRKLREHLDQCPGCRMDWKAMSRIQEQVDHLIEPDMPPELWERIVTELDEDTEASISSEKVIYYPTIRGRMLAEGKGKTSCLNIKFNRLSSR